MGMWSLLATQPGAWRLAMHTSNVANELPIDLLPVPAMERWRKARDLPDFRGGEFRKWFKKRQIEKGTHHE